MGKIAEWSCCEHCHHDDGRERHCEPCNFCDLAEPDDLYENGTDDDFRCMSCGAEVDHHLGCPDDPYPDYEAEAGFGIATTRSRRLSLITGPTSAE